MTLQKWLSSSPELIPTMPEELRETSVSTLNMPSRDCPRTLWLDCNTVTDSACPCYEIFFVPVPTKRDITTAVCKTCDVLHWFTNHDPIKDTPPKSLEESDGLR